MLPALCTGVGDVGPKFDTYMPLRGVLEVSFCSFLDQLARKFDGSRITVKISAEALLGSSVPNSSRGGDTRGTMNNVIQSSRVFCFCVISLHGD